MLVWRELGELSRRARHQRPSMGEVVVAAVGSKVLFPLSPCCYRSAQFVRVLLDVICLSARSIQFVMVVAGVTQLVGCLARNVRDSLVHQERS